MTINRRSLFSIFAGIGALAAGARVTKAAPIRDAIPPVTPAPSVTQFIYDPSHTHSFAISDPSHSHCSSYQGWAYCTGPVIGHDVPPLRAK